MCVYRSFTKGPLFIRISDKTLKQRRHWMCPFKIHFSHNSCSTFSFSTSHMKFAFYRTVGCLSLLSLKLSYNDDQVQVNGIAFSEAFQGARTLPSPHQTPETSKIWFQKKSIWENPVLKVWGERYVFYQSCHVWVKIKAWSCAAELQCVWRNEAARLRLLQDAYADAHILSCEFNWGSEGIRDPIGQLSHFYHLLLVQSLEGRTERLKSTRQHLDPLHAICSKWQRLMVTRIRKRSSSLKMANL